MENGVMIVELDVGALCCGELLEEITRLEKKIFPKHESFSRSLHEELRKKNSGLLYARAATGKGGGGEVVGYVMYKWISSLCASITKLASEVTRCPCPLCRIAIFHPNSSPPPFIPMRTARIHPSFDDLLLNKFVI